MSIEMAIVLSNIGICLVTIILSFVTAMDIGKDERKFVLTVMTLGLAQRKIVRSRKRKPQATNNTSEKAPEKAPENAPHLIIVRDISASDREKFSGHAS